MTEECLAPEVDVDATSGSVLRVHAGGAALTDNAWGSRHYMLGDPKDKKPIDVTRNFHVIGPNSYSLRSEGLPHVFTQDVISFDPATNRTVGRTYEQSTLGEWDAFHPRGPGAAVDAHYHVSEALRYFGEVHNRHGLNDDNGDVYVVVHDNLGNNGGPNAQAKHTQTEHEWWRWDVWTVDDQISIGDGDLWMGEKSARNFLPFSAAFDVMAHEVTHRVTAHTSNLKYENQSGALNESFSDVMGISADHWLFPDRHNDPNKLEIGERLTPAMDKPLRSMSSPSIKHVNEMPPCAAPKGGPKGNDLCYVHSNSGIPNRAWAFMAFGLIHQKSGMVLTSPLGWEKAAKLWYATMTRLGQQATFLDAAVAQVTWAQARNDIQGALTIACAWHAVGVMPLDESITPFANVVCGDADTSSSVVEPPKPPPTTTPDAACAAQPNGWVCDPKAVASAYACNGGSRGGSVLCADLAQRCKPRSSTDLTATVDTAGNLDCEGP